MTQIYPKAVKPYVRSKVGWTLPLPPKMKKMPPPSTTDHIIPLSRGGSNTDPANFRPRRAFHNSQLGGRQNRAQKRRRRRWANHHY